MNPFSLFAFILCWAAVFGAQILDGGHPGSLFSHPGPLLLVFGGSLAAAAVGSQLSDIKVALVGLKHAYLGKKIPKVDKTISSLSELANAARGDGGLMAMEAKVKDFADDPFLTRGVELILDGVDPEEMRDLLESDISAMEERHKVGAKFWEMCGGYAPTIGIVGTVMSLVHVLRSSRPCGASRPPTSSTCRCSTSSSVSPHSRSPTASSSSRASWPSTSARRPARSRTA